MWLLHSGIHIYLFSGCNDIECTFELLTASHVLPAHKRKSTKGRHC